MSQQSPIIQFRESLAASMNSFRKYGVASKAAGISKVESVDMDPAPKNDFEAAIPVLSNRRGVIAHKTEQLEAELASAIPEPPSDGSNNQN